MKKTKKPRGKKPNGIDQQNNAIKFKDDFVYEGVDAIAGITNYGAMTYGSNPKLEIEYNDKYFVVTSTRFDDTVARRAYIGDFDITDDGIIKRATVSEERYATSECGVSLDFSSALRFAPYTIYNVDGLVRFWAATVTATREIAGQGFIVDSSDPIHQILFPKDWCADPFAPNII